MASQSFLGRPSAGDSPFAIGDKALRDTSSPQPPSQRNPTPRRSDGFMDTPSPYGTASDEGRRRYEERYARKRAESEAKSAAERQAQSPSQPPPGSGYGGPSQQQYPHIVEEHPQHPQHLQPGSARQPQQYSPQHPPPQQYSPQHPPAQQYASQHPPPQQYSVQHPSPQQFSPPPQHDYLPPQQQQRLPPAPQPISPHPQYQQRPISGQQPRPLSRQQQRPLSGQQQRPISGQQQQAFLPPGAYPSTAQPQHQQSPAQSTRPPSLPRPPNGYQSPPTQHQQQRWSNPPPASTQWSNTAASPPSQQWSHPQSPPPPQHNEDAELRALFGQFDSSRSGQLNSYDLQRLLAKDATMEAREDCVKMLMNIFDTDRSGSINFMEFEGLYRYIKDWHGIFLRFDRDGSGLIDRKELHQALLGFGFSLPSDMVRKVEKRFAPPPKPGQRPEKGISFDRFLMACVTVKHFTEAFRKADTRGEGRLTLDYNQFMEMVLNAPA